MDTFLVHSALQGVNGAQWKLLGMNLSIPWNRLDAIENETSFPGDVAKKEEVIRLWMSQEPTWKMLVEALSQPTIGLSQKASQISQEHSKYLTIIIVIYSCIYFYIDVPLQEKILESNSSVCPGEDVLQSLAAIIDSRWQCLASPLSLTSEDIVSIKAEIRGAEPTRQALVMLQKWAARETATYGQLREKLRTLRILSVFHI